MKIWFFIPVLVTWLLFGSFEYQVHCETEILWPQNAPFAYNDFVPDSRALYDDDAAPEGRRYHKIKKLKKKLLLLCLLGGGTGGSRQIRSSPVAEGKIFFPFVQQNTDVNVGGSGLHGHQGSDNDEHSSTGGINCDQVLSSGVGQLNHPLLGSLGGLLGGNQGSSDDNKLRRTFIRPIYKSMRLIYKYFK